MKKNKVWQNILIVLVVAALLVAVKLLLGTKTFMYMNANDIDHVTVSTTSGAQFTTTGDDTARLVNILRKVVTHVPANGTPAADTISLSVCKRDGHVTEMQISGAVFTVDGKAYKAKAADGQAVADWAAEIAAK